jgi:hypothetical protein
MKPPACPVSIRLLANNDHNALIALEETTIGEWVQMHACLGRRRLQLNPLFNSLLWPVALAMRSSVLVDGVRPPFSKALHILLSGFEFRGEFGL